MRLTFLLFFYLHHSLRTILRSTFKDFTLLLYSRLYAGRASYLRINLTSHQIVN